MNAKNNYFQNQFNFYKENLKANMESNQQNNEKLQNRRNQLNILSMINVLQIMVGIVNAFNERLLNKYWWTDYQIIVFHSKQKNERFYK